MAITKTTLASACALNDKTITVTSATGFAALNLVRVDNEVMQVTKDYVSGTLVGVLRGVEGSQQLAHVSGANAITYLASDAVADGPQGPSTSFPSQPAWVMRSYSAAGAITMPGPGQCMIAVINGTGALAMTLASPTNDMDGCLLIITNGGKAAHTVTLTAGFGANGANSDVLTWNAGQSGALLAIAINGVWNAFGYVAGAATVAGPGVA